MSELVIPMPVHPDDRDLPLSVVQLKLPSGGVAILTLPIQGQKTIETFEAILKLWKTSLVVKGDYQI